MTRTLLLIAFAVTVATACSGQTDRAHSTAVSGPIDSTPPMRLVREYVERDARGERLQSNPWFLNAVIWEDEPGYDSYTLITGYRLRALHADSSTGRVEVAYTRAGYVRATGDSSVSFKPDAAREVQVFTVALTFNGWRIVAPQLDQHVLVEPALTQSPFSPADRRRLQTMR